METKVKFAVDEIQIVKSEEYSQDEFAIARIGFLGSNPNSHELKISNDVLMAYAPTVLGKFLVAEINEYTGDATTHTSGEIIHGYFPKEQNVQFSETADGYIRAYADAVVSKVYAKDLCDIFESGNRRNVSVEMWIETENGNPTNDVVNSFNIVGVTVLGFGVRPSSPGSDMGFVRFSEEKANDYFTKLHDSALKKFARERRQNMEEYVNHPIDTSKAAVYDGDWDGDKAKHDLIKEEKFTSLAPKVCLRLEEGWKDREVSKLGYPVMCLHEGKWVYSRKGLASALGYAKQHGDSDIVTKVEGLYKKLGLDSDGKEESAKMDEFENINNQEQEFAEKQEEAQMEENCPNCGKPMNECECSEAKCAEDEHKAEQECECADPVGKDDDIDDDDKDDKDDKDDNIDDGEEKEAKMSEEEMVNYIAELKSEIESRDNIIMEKDVELEDLRKFKKDRLEQDKAITIASVLNSVEEFMDKTEFESYREEGMKCDFSEIDAWTNKVKASIVDKAIKKNSKKSVEFTRIAAPLSGEDNKPKNVWDRIKNK